MESFEMELSRSSCSRSIRSRLVCLPIVFLELASGSSESPNLERLKQLDLEQLNLSTPGLRAS